VQEKPFCKIRSPPHCHQQKIASQDAIPFEPRRQTQNTDCYNHDQIGDAEQGMQEAIPGRRRL
jgi:hypothetical protein